MWGGKAPAATALSFLHKAEPVLNASLYLLDLKVPGSKWKVIPSRDLGQTAMAQPPRMWAAMSQLSPGAALAMMA